VTPGDVLFLRGSPEGIVRLRQLAAAPLWEPPQPAEETVVTDLDRAVDVLVEMKNLSEAAVGLAYSALVLTDPTLASEVQHLEDRLDEMKDRLELWVLRAAADNLDPSPLRGLLHLAQAAEDIGDQAQQMVQLIDDREDIHPVLAVALGESDDVVMMVPVAKSSSCDGASLGELGLQIEPGFTVLAIRRGGAYLYRPRGHVRLHAGDELIASGPDEGRILLAELCGWRLVEDEDTGEHELLPA
ncbi:MAG: potassium channel protein, partial [Acidimicrobiia bacterium]|nr:potassium channel protein [Acidimicrobiia bacterium]